MACDSQTLITAAASKGFQALSERELKECCLYVICAGGAGALTAAQILALAIAQGYEKMSDRDLAEATLAALCP